MSNSAYYRCPACNTLTYERMLYQSGTYAHMCTKCGATNCLHVEMQDVVSVEPKVIEVTEFKP